MNLQKCKQIPCTHRDLICYVPAIDGIFRTIAAL